MRSFNRMLIGAWLVGVVLIWCDVMNGQILSPEDFLPTEFGEQFTPHHHQVAYLEYLAASSDNIIIQNYGETNQKRPLNIGIISSTDNLNNLESIRNQHLSSLSKKSDNIKIGVVWLSFGVHGNEAGASEASMNTMHRLITDQKYKSALESLVIIVDPCLNPEWQFEIHSLVL